MQGTQYGLVLKNGEIKKLKEICEKYNIPLTYPSLFDKEEPFHILWAFSKKGIGLVGITIMWHFSKNNIKIFHGVKQMEEFLANNNNRFLNY